MVDYQHVFIVCQNVHQAHLQEVGLMQIPAHSVKVKGLRQLYNLWIRVKGPHKHMVTALGSCVRMGTQKTCTMIRLISLGV